MSDDPFESIADQDHDRRMQGARQQAARDVRIARRNRIIRHSLRWTIIGCSLVGMGLLYLLTKYNSTILGVGFAICLFATIAAGTVLFFMGGLAPL